MRKAIWLALLLSTLVSAQFHIVKVQNDWRYGPGLSDTVNNWGARYWSGGGINHALLPMPLMSGTIDPTAWVQHPLETSSEVGAMNWGARCADIDEDGDPDIVAVIDDSLGHLVWYENLGSFSFSRHDIDISKATNSNGWYDFTSDTTEGGDRCAVYPADFNGDGHIDVVVGDYYGIYVYFGNGAGSFPSGAWVIGAYPPNGWHCMDLDVADADGDGDKDIVAVMFYGYEAATSYSDPAYDIVIFWNNGSGSFPSNTVVEEYTWSSEAGYDAPDGAFWRVKFADFDGDGTWESVVYEWFELNGWAVDYDGISIESQSPPGSHYFPSSYVYRTPPYTWDGSENREVDGLWIADFDMDGDQDVIIAVPRLGGYNGDFYVIQNDGGGTFSQHWLLSDPSSHFCDGAIMADMDGDGLNDIVGTYTDVGYIRRTGTGYTDFTEYLIDNSPPDDNAHASHWVYPCNLDGGTDCSGDGDLDLIVVWDNMIMLYENQMISYVPSGSLYSAVLAVPIGFDTCVACSVAWDGCTLDGYTVTVDARIGASLAECNSAPWGGHNTQPWRDGNPGEPAGNTSTPNDTVWVQYRITITRTTGAVDRTPTIDSVWVILYPTECAETCDSFTVRTDCPDTCGFITSCADQGQTFVLYPTNSVSAYPADSEVTITVYVNGSPVGSGTVATLSWASLSADSFLYVSPPSGSWNNGDTVRISISSTYSCPYIEPFECSFIVDTLPPSLISYSPPNDTVVSDSIVNISGTVYDSLAGVNGDSSRYVVVVHHADATVDTVANSTTDGSINYTGHFADGDSVVICVHMVDDVYANPSDCTCEPNYADSCWWFTVQLCSPIFAEWGCPGDSSCWNYVSCETQSMSLLLWSEDPVDTARVYIRVNGTYLSPTGTNLNFSCVDAACDSVIATIENFIWHDGDSVVIQLDSAFTTTGCKTMW